MADALIAAPALAELEQEVTLDFQEVNLIDAVSFLQKITAVTIVIDPKVVAANPPPISLRVEKMKLRFVLDFIAKLTGLAWKFRNEAMFLTTEDGQAAAQAPAPAPAKPVRRGTDDF